MRVVLPSELQPGMKLARPVYSLTTGALLLREGTIIKAGHRDLLRGHSCTPIFISDGEDNGGAGAGSLQIISYADWVSTVAALPDGPEKLLYLQCYRTVNEIFAGYRAGSVPDVGAARDVAREVVGRLFQDPQLWLQLAMLKDLDQYSAAHSVNVCIFSLFLGFHLGYNQRDLVELGTGALLHDVGKLDVPRAILSKPGKLDAGEYDMVKQHPVSGYRRLQQSPAAGECVLSIILGHHERCDGSGYPLGLSGARIPQKAMVVAICDVYDAVTTDRAYRPRMLPHEGMEVVMADSTRGKLDRDLVLVFLREIAMYPAGTVVELNTGEVAEVVEVTPGLPLRPVLRVISPPQSRGRVYDLASKPTLLITGVIGRHGPAA
ncbi:MAG: HD-GYP domain-containing protein [Clostridia bacterium]|nr:MAG: HD-GYP domain-containing protein [Clostridia bacterium]